MEVHVAKSIRLTPVAQQMVSDEVNLHLAETSVVISDAQMVAALVKEAVEARDWKREQQMRGPSVGGPAGGMRRKESKR